MRVSEVTTGVVRVPLPMPVRNGTVTIVDRDYVFVRVKSTSGHTGVSCGFARGGDLVGPIRNVFGPMSVGRGVHEPQLVTAEMWRRARPFLGSNGQVARAISLIDMALWDLHATVVGLPLADLLGAGGVDSVPVMAASGYYRSSDPAVEVDEVRREYAALADVGYTRVKIMVGGAEPGLDALRVAAAAEAAGMPVGIDVNGAWASTADAERLLRELPEAMVEFVEEPFPAGQVDVLRRFRASRRIPVAVGEWESDIDVMRHMMAEGLIDIARLDVTAIGGVTGWLSATPLATSYAIPVLPHYFPMFHAPLLAATPTALAVEIVPESSGAENFPALILDGPAVDKGRLPLSDRPGFGVQWDWDRIESYTTEVV